MSRRFIDLFKEEMAYFSELIEHWQDELPEFDSIADLIDQDSDAQKIIESAAFLNAKLRQRLDDDFPEITQQLLQRTWQTPLCPLPAALVVKFFANTQQTIPAHAVVMSNQAQIESYQLRQSTETTSAVSFRTSHAVTVFPIRVDEVQVEHTPDSTSLTLTLSWEKGQVSEQTLSSPLVFFLGEDTKVASLLQLYLTQYVERVRVKDPSSQLVYRIYQNPFSTDIFNHDAEVLPKVNQGFEGLQKIPEYFSLPTLHHFLTMQLPQSEMDIQSILAQSTLTLSVHFDRVLPTNRPISRENFQLNCVPAMNLYSHCLKKIPLDRAHYSIKPPKNAQIHSIEKIALYVINEEGKEMPSALFQFQSAANFSATYHESARSYYYYLLLDTDVRDEITYHLYFIDSEGKPFDASQLGTQQFKFECHLFFVDDQCVTQQIQSGDICYPADGVPDHVTLANITAPSLPQSPIVGSQEHWQIINHFSVNPKLLSQDKTLLQALLHELNLYRCSEWIEQRQTNMHPHIQGILAVSSKGIDWLFKGVPSRGMLLELVLAPEHYHNIGEMFQFSQLVAAVFAHFLENTNFVICKTTNHQTQEVWTSEPAFGRHQPI